MLEIWLDTGQFIAKHGKREVVVSLNDFVLPITKYAFKLQEYLEGLPSIEQAYIECMRQGYTEDKLIEKLIEMYLPIRYFKAGDYEKVDMCIGLCGHRGAGKTAGAVGIALFDFMLRGLDCWSNVPIEVRVCYKKASRVYRSKDIAQVELLDLDGGYKGGALLADECNLQFASAYKSQSNANQDFGAIIQQLRKRRMSIIWTAQSFMSVDKNSVRFQTDFMVGCRDQHLSGKDDVMGNTSEWRVYDIGGLTGKYSLEYELSHPYITQYEIGDGMIHYNRPLWFAYNSYELQGSNYIAQYKAAKAGQGQDIKQELVVGKENEARQYIRIMKEKGITEFWAHELWEGQGITADPSAMRMWGKALAKEGYERKRNKKCFYRLNNGSEA